MKYQQLSMLLLIVLMSSCVNHEPASITKEPTPLTKATGKKYPDKLLWGDTHVHSHLSSDAHSLGNKNLSPEDAYRFARGEAITLHDDSTAILKRPLDFLVVADHAEYLGVNVGLDHADQHLLQNETAQEWHHHLTSPDGDPSVPMSEFAESLSSGKTKIDLPDYYHSVWRKMINMAEEAYQPGVFTSLMGYEWSSMPGGDNLHRVVVFRDGEKRVKTHRPFSALDSNEPEDLWAVLTDYESTTGGRVLTIPHNPNISGGKMFDSVMSNGLPIDKKYAETRAHFEKVVEVTQVKGDSETHPFLSPDDEFADFERWDRSNVGMQVEHENDWFKGEYVRSALKMGLQLEQTTGVNPFQLGMIGSTDQHNSTPQVLEDDFTGKFVEPKVKDKERWKYTILPETAVPQIYYEWELAAAGYAAVWAHENTREEVFDALHRRESFATTGPRIEARFFAGWGYNAIIFDNEQWPQLAYQLGKPMGEVISNKSERGSPQFLLHAKKDPQGANLDRIQIIKGWVDSSGEAHEKVYDVVLSDKSRRLESGNIESVGSSVDVANASYTNDIGKPILFGLWEDADYNPTDNAFYYMRVLEIPTPRWTTYDIKRYGAEIPDYVPRTIQERAYTSPIWVSAKK